MLLSRPTHPSSPPSLLLLVPGDLRLSDPNVANLRRLEGHGLGYLLAV